MNLGGIGKGSGDSDTQKVSSSDLLKPATDTLQKMVTAGKIKSIKLKVKLKKTKAENSDGQS